MGRLLNLHLGMKLALAFALCTITTGCFPRSKDTDIHIGVNREILESAEKIRNMRGRPSAGNDKSAQKHFERALEALRASTLAENIQVTAQFRAGEKLFDAYVSYLTTSKRLLPAAEVLRVAVQEADRVRSYRVAIRYRILLADTLARIGQIEAGRRSVAEAQVLVDRVYGKLTGHKEPDIFQLAANAEVLSAKIRLGVPVPPSALSAFSDIYLKATGSNPAVRFVGLETPFMYVGTMSGQMDDDNFYRRDQEFWRWFALGAVRGGDQVLARKFLGLMTDSAEIAARDIYRDNWGRKTPWHNVPYPEPDMYQGYMWAYYAIPELLKHAKYLDTFYGLETEFDSILAGAEIYLTLDDLALAEKMIAQASESLPGLAEYTVKLQAQGHPGTNIEQRAADIKRVSGKLHLKKGQWREALAQLDQFIQWSEEHRNNLPLDQRLPYFRSRVQGSYLDALSARASIYLDDPTEANFLSALDALGRLKARHLIDSLDASNKLKGAEKIPTGKSLEAIFNQNGGFLSISDLGDRLILFFADEKGRNIRIADKPRDFDNSILAFRNDLAEQQKFDSSKAREITAQVLGDLEARVFAQKSLFIEIDGTLSFLPMELLLDANSTPLARNTAVVYIPSLAVFDVNRASKAGKGVLAFGDAQFNQDQQIGALGGGAEYAKRGKRDSTGFLPLPETREEVLSIVSNVREGGKAVLGRDATKSSFFREAHQQYRYLHFATHGVVGGEVPRLNEPALILTPEGDDPGFLTATEIGKLNIAAELVVLSACNSGNGEYFNGEGLMGLGRAFILAGAKGVVVSLWPVDSMTTKDLMMQFYQELEVTGNATLALAKARIAVMENRQNQSRGDQRGIVVKPSNGDTKGFSGYQNPFYWAPFVLVKSGS